MSPQPLDFSPIHINYINHEDGAVGGFEDYGRAHCSKALKASTSRPQRNSFLLPADYLDEADEGNFIIPDPIYADLPLRDDKFHDVLEDAPLDLILDDEIVSAIASTTDVHRSRRKKKYRDREKRKANYAVENEAFLMHEMMDVSTGARRKIPQYEMASTSSSSPTSRCGSFRKESYNGNNSLNHLKTNHINEFF